MCLFNVIRIEAYRPCTYNIIYIEKENYLAYMNMINMHTDKEVNNKIKPLSLMLVDNLWTNILLFTNTCKLS